MNQIDVALAEFYEALKGMRLPGDSPDFPQSFDREAAEQAVAEKAAAMIVEQKNMSFSEVIPEDADPKLLPVGCACGAELMSARALKTRMCGDCQARWCGVADEPLDSRIRGVAADPPASWSAGATPSYEWP